MRNMNSLQPSRTDYVIVAIGIIPIVVTSFWLSEIAAWANVAPKFISAAGIAFSVALILPLTLLIKKDRKRYVLRAGRRAVGLGLLLAGVLYFFMREEIADLVGWSARIGDGLMIFASVLASMWLLGGIGTVDERVEDP